MDLRKLKTLIDLVSESNVSELEITEAEGKVRIVKSSGAPLVMQQPVAMVAAPAAAPAAGAPAAPAADAAPLPISPDPTSDAPIRPLRFNMGKLPEMRQKNAVSKFVARPSRRRRCPTA